MNINELPSCKHGKDPHDCGVTACWRDLRCEHEEHPMLCTTCRPACDHGYWPPECCPLPLCVAGRPHVEGAPEVEPLAAARKLYRAMKDEATERERQIIHVLGISQPASFAALLGALKEQLERGEAHGRAFRNLVARIDGDGGQAQQEDATVEATLARADALVVKLHAEANESDTRLGDAGIPYLDETHAQLSLDCRVGMLVDERDRARFRSESMEAERDALRADSGALFRQALGDAILNKLKAGSKRVWFDEPDIAPLLALAEASMPQRPAYERAMALIGALNADAEPRMLHGALQAAIIAFANSLDAEVKR